MYLCNIWVPRTRDRQKAEAREREPGVVAQLTSVRTSFQMSDICILKNNLEIIKAKPRGSHL